MFCVLIACLLSLPQGQTDPRTSTRRYKPVIQVTEEININDITFTTFAPELERSPSHKTVHHHNRLVDTSPSVFPHVNYRDSYGAVVPVEKIYAAAQPLVVPAVKYKPYKVFKVQDGFRPVVYKPKVQEKTKLKAFEPPTTYSGPDGPKYSKIVPFSSQLAAKAPTRASSYLTQDNRTFIPSPTFSPTVLGQINSETTPNFTEHPDIKPFTSQKSLNWPNPSKKPHQTKKPKQIPENHRQEGEENRRVPTHGPKDPPQGSESFLSEISTIHRGGDSADNLEGVADTLDLKTGERVEFQMYGMDGPQSYKFGFDTGKGHNRHFRFEERDNTGKVKGHYGYLDEEGKMRIMKYEADPITGFHAGPVELSPDDN